MLYDELMARALRLASTTFADMTSEPAVFIQGTSLLLEDVGGESPDVTLETLRTLLRMIEEKARLMQLLDEYISGDGLTVVIGSEHHSPDLQRFSLVASTYSDGRGTGAVGVIGPTRMRYSRAINAVEGLSQGDQPDGQRPILTTAASLSFEQPMEDNRTDPDLDLSEASETRDIAAADGDSAPGRVSTATAPTS